MRKELWSWNRAMWNIWYGSFSAMGNEEETIELCLRIIGMDESNEAAYKRLISIYEKRV